MTVMLGFIARIDHCGASSFIRWLAIRPSLYTAMLSFFRARSWKLGPIMRQWWQVVLERRKRLIAETTDAIGAFVNFGCIATGILQILALSCHKTI